MFHFFRSVEEEKNLCCGPFCCIMDPYFWKKKVKRRMSGEDPHTYWRTYLEPKKKQKKKTEVRSLNLLSDIFPPQTCDQI
jgi:hypothetical protein